MMVALRAALSSTAAQVVLYGILLAAGTLTLAWLDYQRLAHTYSQDIILSLVAIGFLVLGAWLGAKLFRGTPAPGFDGNPKALETLGISPRELAVLQELAAGRSNKEIA